MRRDALRTDRTRSPARAPSSSTFVLMSRKYFSGARRCMTRYHPWRRIRRPPVPTSDHANARGVPLGFPERFARRTECRARKCATAAGSAPSAPHNTHPARAPSARGSRSILRALSKIPSLPRRVADAPFAPTARSGPGVPGQSAPLFRPRWSKLPRSPAGAGAGLRRMHPIRRSKPRSAGRWVRRQM
jgi:hypothetical protein